MLPLAAFDVMVDARDTGLTRLGIPWLSYSTPLALSLGAGIYWVSVVESDPRTPGSAFTQWLWGQSSTDGVFAFGSEGGRWTVAPGPDHAFVLTGVTNTVTVKVKANANGEIQMLGPHQKIHFNIAQGNVEYWNFDNAEGDGSLHYQTTISCSSINKATSEARFMFQIPEGHPGLSGLYVVAYIKIVDAETKDYLYGHAATSDLRTATQWCQTGSGFAPGMYEVKSGVLYIK